MKNMYNSIYKEYIYTHIFYTQTTHTLVVITVAFYNI